jgi:predicted ArsR family transcriptional regulator
MSLLELIADPVRLQIVRRLAGSGHASLQELADAASVHLNTARTHVTALEEAGAVIARPRERPGRGKQGLEYELAEGWTLGAGDFRAIAEVLATAVMRGGLSPEARADVGRAWGRFILGRPGIHEPKEEVVRALEWLGYVAEMSDGQVELSGCPCILVSPDEPRVVCDVAAGLIDGVLEGCGSDLCVQRQRHQPTERRCQIGLGERQRRTRNPA